MEDVKYPVEEENNSLLSSPITSRIKRGNVTNVPLDLIYRIAHYTRRIQRDDDVVVEKEDAILLNQSVNAMVNLSIFMKPTVLS